MDTRGRAHGLAQRSRPRTGLASAVLALAVLAALGGAQAEYPARAGAQQPDDIPQEPCPESDDPVAPTPAGEPVEGERCEEHETGDPSKPKPEQPPQSQHRPPPAEGEPTGPESAQPPASAGPVVPALPGGGSGGADGNGGSGGNTGSGGGENGGAGRPNPGGDGHGGNGHAGNGNGGVEAPHPGGEGAEGSPGPDEAPPEGGVVPGPGPLGPDVVGAPVAVGDRSEIPAFLLPIYRDCGRRYRIPWNVLAAINKIESAFGANMGPSSAGAIGWMQFLPSTWAAYGVDADGNGRRDPYDPEDAVCAAARYLNASGGRADLRRAIFAYNHAEWYVDQVLSLARSYVGIAIHDPLPRARRLDADFARMLARTAHRHRIDWALALAVLRARGERGRVPASSDQVRDLAQRLSRANGIADRRVGEHVRAAFEGGRAFAHEVAVLARYNRAVGVRGLVEGLHAVRDRLERRVLESTRIEIYAGGRDDVAGDRIDVRVLTLLLYVAERHEQVTVTSLMTGHGYYARPGVPSAHSFGRAVDIAAVDAVPILGNQHPGGITERVVRDILVLPRELEPEQVISLLDFGGPSFAAADHDDHIHVGY